jgi:hypothetical protein
VRHAEIPLPFFRALTGLIAALALGACNSTPDGAGPAKPSPQARRAAEQSAALAALPEATQQDVLNGRIARGQSPQVVFVALGKPDVVICTADGRATLWTYRSYFPPQTAEQKKEFTKEIQRRTNTNNPLDEAFAFWRQGANPRTALLDPSIAPRAMGQSAADYARYLRDRELAGPGAEFLDESQQREYEDSLYVPPVPDPVPVQLAVVFLDGAVHDAIVNESMSAFAPSAPVKP